MIQPFKSRKIDLKQPVKVYRNLTKGPGVWYSIIQNGLVVGHSKYIMLERVNFKVNEGARLRVIATKRKNVHAFVVGYIRPSGCGLLPESEQQLPVKISYNPYTQGWFGTSTIKIYRTLFAKLDQKGLSVAYIFSSTDV